MLQCRSGLSLVQQGGCLAIARHRNLERHVATKDRIEGQPDCAERPLSQRLEQPEVSDLLVGWRLRDPGIQRGRVQVGRNVHESAVGTHHTRDRPQDLRSISVSTLDRNRMVAGGTAY